jgi:hypothetical protein
VVVDADRLLEWADRVYREATELPHEYPVDAVQRAHDAYASVQKRLPGTTAARLGKARCLVRLGRYDAAVREYTGLRAPESEVAAARLRASIARQVQARLGKEESVIAVSRVGKNLAVALSGRRWLEPAGRGLPWGVRQVSKLRIRVLTRVDEARWEEAASTAVPLRRSWDAAWEASLSVVPLRPGRSAVVIRHGYFTADNATNDVSVFAFAGRPLRPVGTFHSKATTAVDQDRHGRLRVRVSPTFKVWWTDTYVWDGDRFVFANGQNPDVYPRRPHVLREPTLYTWWMWDAAVLTIHRRRREALAAWRTAERLCRNALSEVRRGVPAEERRYPGWEYYGDEASHLRDIRQRIAWLKKGDWDHWLLYRPYRFDLQVAQASRLRRSRMDSVPAQG